MEKSVKLYNSTPIEEFELREYSKTELAKLYFPRQKAKSARWSFSREVHRCKQLKEALDELLAMRGKELRKCRSYTREEVEFIVFHLGKPGK